MKAIFLSGTLAACMLGQTVLAQIPVLTSADLNMSAGAAVQIADFDASSFNPGTAGANVTWDFSTLQPVNSYTYAGLNPASTPGNAYFPTANIATTLNNLDYEFDLLNSSVFARLGTSKDQAGTITYVAFSDQEDFFRFPLTYLDGFTDSFGGSFLSGGYMVYRTGQVYVDADAYGTLIMPNGTYNNVLRIRLQEVYRDSMDLGGFPYLIDYESDYFIYYQPGTLNFILNAGTLSIAGQTTKTGFFRTGAVGTDVSASLQGVDLAPNPATHESLVKFSLASPAAVTITVQNLSGAVVQEIPAADYPAGAHFQSLDLTGLSAGMYMVTVQTGDSRVTQKLSVR